MGCDQGARFAGQSVSGVSHRLHHCLEESECSNQRWANLGREKVLINGQQRITALSAALVGQEVVTKEYKVARIRIAFDPRNERFEVSNPAIVKDKAWIPDITPVMQNEISMLKPIRQYREANPDFDEDDLERVITQLIGITKKQIGMIELAAELDIETVTEIFIRINREGVTLSQANFAMSKIASNEAFGGHELRKAIDYFCHLAVAPEFYGHVETNDVGFAKTDYFSAGFKSPLFIFLSLQIWTRNSGQGQWEAIAF